MLVRTSAHWHPRPEGHGVLSSPQLHRGKAVTSYLKRIRALRRGTGDSYDQTIDELLRLSAERRWLKGDWVDNVQTHLGEAVVEERYVRHLRRWNAGALLAVFDIVLPLPPDKDGVSYSGPRRRDVVRTRKEATR